MKKYIIPPIRAVVAVTEHVADGLVNVSEAEQERRKKICSECIKYDAKKNTCSVCGCYMKWKSAWRSSHCPDNPPKW